jgi:hypothetical protein
MTVRPLEHQRLRHDSTIADRTESSRRCDCIASLSSCSRSAAGSTAVKSLPEVLPTNSEFSDSGGVTLK